MNLEQHSFLWAIVAALITSVVTSIGAVWAFGQEIIAPAFKQKFKENLYTDQDLDRWLTEKFLLFIYNNPEFDRWLKEFCRNQFDLENDKLENEVFRLNKFLQCAVYDQQDGVLPKLLRTRGRNAKNFQKLNDQIKKFTHLFNIQNNNNLRMICEINYNRRLVDAIKNYLKYATKTFPHPFDPGSDANNINEYAQGLIHELTINTEEPTVDNTENSSIDYYYNPVKQNMKNAFDSQPPQDNDYD